METLAIIALACNIAQLVEQGIEVAELCKDIRESDSPREHTRLKELTALSKKVDKDSIALKSLDSADALDEFEEYAQDDHGQSHLLAALEKMVNRFGKVKVLCSTRPDAPFKYRLSATASFRLQHVNYYDIGTFCRNELAGTKAQKFAEDIARRAEGVFLWAHIVAKDLHRAAKRNASERELEQRLQMCPSEMSELFSSLMQRQDEFYKQDPQAFLSLIDFCRRQEKPVTLFHLLLATQPPGEMIERVQAVFDDEFLKELDARAEGFEEEVLLRCSGLVEVHEGATHYSDMNIFAQPCQIFNHLRFLITRKVGFIHRTAIDFLHDSDRIPSGLMSVSTTEAALRLAAAETGFLCLYDRPVDSANAGPGWFFRTYNPRFSRIYLTQSGEKEVCRRIYSAFAKRLSTQAPTQDMTSEVAMSYLWSRHGIREVCPDLSMKTTIYLFFCIYPEERHDIALPYLKTLDPVDRDSAAAYTLFLWMQYSTEFHNNQNPAIVHDMQNLFPELLSLVSPSFTLRLYSKAFGETPVDLGSLSLWHIFISLAYSIDDSYLMRDIAESFVSQGASIAATSSYILHEDIDGSLFRHILPPADLEMRSASNDGHFLYRRSAESILNSGDSTAIGVAYQWSPMGLTRNLEIPEHMSSAFSTESSRWWSEMWQNRDECELACVRLLNSQIETFSQEELQSLSQIAGGSIKDWCVIITVMGVVTYAKHRRKSRRS